MTQRDHPHPERLVSFIVKQTIVEIVPGRSRQLRFEHGLCLGRKRKDSKEALVVSNL